MLNLYNVDLEERKGEANEKRWSGIVYTATNDRGEWVGTPIKSSALTPKGGMKFLEKQITKNDGDIKSEQLKGPIRGTIARAMHRARTQAAFVELLKADGIDAVLRENKDGRITGATFVDHRTRTVLNGSRLGKSYSANVFQELFNNPAADRTALLPKLTVPAPSAPRQQTAEQPRPERPAKVTPPTPAPAPVPELGHAAEQPTPPTTPARQTERIHTVPRGLSPQPRPAQPAPRGVGESLAGLLGDMLGQPGDGSMSQDEFEALRQSLSRRRKRKKRGITR